MVDPRACEWALLVEGLNAAQVGRLGDLDADKGTPFLCEKGWGHEGSHEARSGPRSGARWIIQWGDT